MIPLWSPEDNTWFILDGSVYSSSFDDLPNGNDLSDGGYTIQAVAIDKANNRKTATINVTADQGLPTISFTSPTNNKIVTNLNLIRGRAADNTTGTGISRVDLLIQRRSDGKYWTGTAWSATSTVLKTVVSGTTWTRSSGNPTGALLLNGSYNLIAIAYDKALNSTRAQIMVTVRKAASIALSNTAASTVRLSSAIADAATASVQLRFIGALDVDTASDPANYTVTVNGQAVTVESAGYNASNNSVSLSLPSGSLHSGDQVSVQASGVVDAHGAAVNAQSGALTAH